MHFVCSKRTLEQYNIILHDIIIVPFVLCSNTCRVIGGRLVCSNVCDRTTRNVWIQKRSVSSRFWSASVTTRVDDDVVSIPRLITCFERVRDQNGPYDRSKSTSCRIISMDGPSKVHKIDCVLSPKITDTGCATQHPKTNTTSDQRYETSFAYYSPLVLQSVELNVLFGRSEIVRR